MRVQETKTKLILNITIILIYEECNFHYHFGTTCETTKIYKEM